MSQPGRLSLSVATVSTTEANGRGRKVSCSIALAIAGAFAAVSVGSVFVFGMMRGEDSTAGSGGNSYDSAPTASAAPTTEPGPQKGGQVPTKLLGTWEGDAYALDGNLPAGTFTKQVIQGRPGP